MSRITVRQYHVLEREYRRTKKVGKAAMKAGMDRKTASKYLQGGSPPNYAGERTWRTREDPFEGDWPGIERKLKMDGELEAATLFEELERVFPGRYRPGQLRTLQRRVKRWKAQNGPEKEIWFPQEHRPGEILETDWTDMATLGVRIGGKAFAHKICHSVLTYSNWECATLCQTESLLSLRGQLKKALGQLGCVPRFHRTDHSSTATHTLRRGQPARDFNGRYLDLMAAFGMTPAVIQKKKPEQNGDVESANGHIKRRVGQALKLRGSRDFASRSEYEAFIEEVCDRANRSRKEKLEEEIPVMKRVDVSRIAGWEESATRVNRNGFVWVGNRPYSVPTRLVGETVQVRATEETLEVWYGGVLQARRERLGGSGIEGLDYRDLVGNLVKKPGAFGHCRFWEALFPGEAFRDFYGRLQKENPAPQADRLYLAILHRAAIDGEEEVLAALEILKEKEPFTLKGLEDLLAFRAGERFPVLEEYLPDPGVYDMLVSRACFEEVQA